MRQTDLAERSGVTLASVRRFEKEGEVSLKNLVLIAIALNRAPVSYTHLDVYKRQGLVDDVLENLV